MNFTPVMNEAGDLLLGKLKSAREALCVAQVHVTSGHHVADLQVAIDRIDRLGVWYSGPDRQWSKHDVPDPPGMSDLPSEATIRYALHCAANWLEERGGPGYVDLPDERGEILRWMRDNPDDDDD